MGFRSVYGKKPSGQMKSSVSKLTAGLNEHNTANVIGDAFMSDMWGVRPYRDEAIEMWSQLTNASKGSNLTGDGIVYSAIADKYPTDVNNSAFQEHLFLITREPSISNDYIDYLVDANIDANTKNLIDLSSYTYAFAAVHSMCLFFTEAVRYVCYSNSLSKKLLVYDHTVLRQVDLPFYPKRICSHVNRIFIIDINNKLWWCRVGDFLSWYGLEEDDDRIVASVAMSNVALTLANQPDVPRVLTFTVTKTVTLDTLGIATVVGTATDDVAQTEIATLREGKLIGMKVFKTVSSVTISGHTAVAGADLIQVGTGALGNGWVQDDAGYWTLEQERTLVNLAVLSNNLYIWTDQSIYAFQGHTYDTFNLAKVVTNIGASGDIAVANNVAYFKFGNDLYEYNGEEFPRIISRPVHVNGQLANGIMGGIGSYFVASTGHIFNALNQSDPAAVGLVADQDNLYYYNRHPAVTYDNACYQGWIYIFNMKERSWFKIAGFSGTYANAGVQQYVEGLYVPYSDRTGIWNVETLGNTADVADWCIREREGLSKYGGAFFITKAFSEGISSDVSLSEIIMLMQSVDTDMTLKVYYSLNVLDQATDDSWVLLWQDIDHNFTGDIDRITINVGNTAISRAMHYRLKFVIDTEVPLYLYGFERRFRVIERSR